MQTGKVKFFNREKGFGFVIADDDKKEYFVHKSECHNYVPNEGDEVQFELIDGKKGKMCGNVSLL